MTEILIDQEFKNLMPSLAEDEYSILESSIKEEGCRDPLVLWHGYIIDGVNRYEICQRCNVPFKTISKTFDNKDDVKVWIIRNQLGRRNLIPAERARLALLLKPSIQKEAKEKQKEEGKRLGGKRTLPQKSAKPPIETRDELAKIAGVSHDTIHKMEVIEKEAPKEVKESVRKGEMSINKGYQATKKPTQSRAVETVQDSDALFHLKRWWKKATKKDKKLFLAWIKAN